MMDKKPHIKPYLYGMFAGFGAISLSILFFFLIYRFQGFGNAVSTLTGILMPFIYGSVIAYLLKPVCNWIEAFLHKLFPERMHRFANMLAVALTILFGLLLIYALIMMIVPQLINSVTALYFTARDNIGDFVEWISKQEFIANNKKLLDFIENSYDSLDANLDQEHPAPLHAEHPQRCRRGRGERGDLDQEFRHRPHRFGVSAGQPEEVRAAGQAHPL